MSCYAFSLIVKFHKVQWNPQYILYDCKYINIFNRYLTPVNQCRQFFFLTSYSPVSIGEF